MSEEVNIILSTYNGEKYISELLTSLLNQNYPNLKITIRDDGSSDNTMSIIESFVESRSNIRFLKGQNLGVIDSFFTLLQEAEHSSYYAFCDQDDIWLPDKIERAVNAINRYPENKPVMYCSAVNLVDENLNHIGSTTERTKNPGFGNALVENIAIGCTIVINKSARDILIKKLPQNAIMHDWWVYLVLSAFGEVIYDSIPSILYRQHSSNVVGVKPDTIGKWVNRIKQYKSKNGERLFVKQVSEFYQIYKFNMDRRTVTTTEDFINESMLIRVRNIIKRGFYRQLFIDDIIIKMLYLCKKI